MLQNASLLAIVAVDTAENEPSKVCRGFGAGAPRNRHLEDVLLKGEPFLPDRAFHALGAPDADVRPVVSDEIPGGGHRGHPRSRCPTYSIPLLCRQTSSIGIKTAATGF